MLLRNWQIGHCRLSGASDGGLLLDSISCWTYHNCSSFQWKWCFVAVPLRGELVFLGAPSVIWLWRTKCWQGLFHSSIWLLKVCCLWTGNVCFVVESILAVISGHGYKDLCPYCSVLLLFSWSFLSDKLNSRTLVLGQDGAPPLGWGDTIAYLVLPVLLVGSQYVSMQMMQPATAVRITTHWHWVYLIMWMIVWRFKVILIVCTVGPSSWFYIG